MDQLSHRYETLIPMDPQSPALLFERTRQPRDCEGLAGLRQEPRGHARLVTYRELARALTAVLDDGSKEHE